MKINQIMQNVWRREGVFNLLPTVALYYANDKITKDYGIIVGWLCWTYSVEIWKYL